MKELTQPLKTLKGVGEVRTRAFASLGVVTVADLLFFFPRRYEDRRTLTPLSQLVPDALSAAVASIVSIEKRPLPGRRAPLTTVLLGDGSSFARAIWFNAPNLGRILAPGMKLALYGKVMERRGLQWVNPEFEILDERDPTSIGTIVPVYPLASGLSQKFLRHLIQGVLSDYGPLLNDFLPDTLRKKLCLPPLSRSIKELHLPKGRDTWLRARNRLAFDELFLLQTGLSLRRRQREISSPQGESLSSGSLFEVFLQKLPFSLTDAQRRAIHEILQDLRSPSPMYRLLQGDVGSGKTIVAAAAALVAVDSGVQTAFMAPTEILAQQHFLRLKKIFDPLNVRVTLLTGSLGAAERRAALADIADGSAPVVVGTHALQSEGTQFSKLGLILVDEQHRFGVLQKNALAEKADRPHVLVMTATPIPRTLTLSIYGDLDISILDELPPGRKPVKTLRARPTQEAALLRFLRERVEAGEQAYWVCPVIDEDETKNITALTTRFQRLTALLPGVRISSLHGQLPSEEKEEAMRLFAAGEIDVLVATVLIEVGVDVPGATLMVVEDAGRFGLAQLHQLRGRVGRGDKGSVCVLLEGPSGTPEGRARIEAMLRTTDGFQIAEADLKQRGPGELCGVRQHGITDFRVADLTKDQKILERARMEALELLENDPDLHRAPLLKQEIQRRLGNVLKLAGTA
ncbi:MAG: ATP-dependent DNA helicase RecG [Fretibacterium sp.]|nr:ATP-dependent DNA helicase RecG [Fretibacterium sp.]